MFIQISAGVTCQRRGLDAIAEKSHLQVPNILLRKTFLDIYSKPYVYLLCWGFSHGVEKTNKIQHKSLFSTKFLTNRPERCRTIAICTLCRLFSTNMESYSNPKKCKSVKI